MMCEFRISNFYCRRTVLIDTFAIKWLLPKNAKGKKKRPQAEHKSHAKKLALVLLASIRNGGHSVTATSWANGYELSPDNAAKHVINEHEMLQTHRQLAYILGIRQWKPSHLNQHWKPSHWQHIFFKTNGSKWTSQMQKALTTIHWADKCDPEIIQMRCEPTKGLHSLVRTMSTGSTKERDNSMIALYLAMLRANAARWESQNKVLRKAYRTRGIIADHRLNLIYRRTHELVPGDEYRQYTAEMMTTEENDDNNHENTTCSACRSPKIQLQLTCKRCKQCLKCMNITVCKFAPQECIDTLPSYIKQWAKATRHPTPAQQREKQRRAKPRHGKRKTGSKSEQRTHNQKRRRKANFRNFSQKWKKLLRDTYNALDSPQETTSQDETYEKVKRWLIRQGLNPQCKNQTDEQIITFENIDQNPKQTRKEKENCIIILALALKIYESKKQTNKIQTEREMWMWYFKQAKSNRANMKSINAAAIEKAIQILEKCGIKPIPRTVSIPTPPPSTHHHSSDSCPEMRPEEQPDGAYTAWI